MGNRPRPDRYRKSASWTHSAPPPSPSRAPLSLATACAKPNPLFCDEDTPCTLLERPVCDFDGSLPGSDDVPNTCVPDPGVDAGPDGGSVAPDVDARVCPRELAFSSRRDGNAEIYRTALDESPQTNVTMSEAQDMEFAWSPDGTMLAVTRDFAIWVMNADGTEQVPLTSIDDGLAMNPTWSPSSTHLAFTRQDDDQNSSVWKVAAAGGTPTVLATHLGPDAVDSKPAWSPDGEQIAFVSNRDGDREIYVMAADGTNALNLTQDPGQDGNAYEAPLWSPDGATIVFHATRAGLSNLWRMDRDGSNQRNLTNGDLGLEVNPTWWPDGSKLLFDRADDLYIMNADGTNQRKFTTHPTRQLEAAVSPDGAWVAWSSYEEGNYEVYVANGDGLDALRVTSDAEDDLSPAWRPCP